MAMVDYTDPNRECDHVFGEADAPTGWCEAEQHTETEILANWLATLPPPPESTPSLAYALGCARRGWYVFPCWWIEDGHCACGEAECSAGKHPIAALVPRGVLDASVFPRTITQWWTRYPRANLALATGRSGLIIADLDPRHGADEAAFWKKVGARGETVRTLTPSGGIHLWFTAPPGEFAPSVGKFLPGIDIRAGGSYVMLPPSNHTAGSIYDFEVGCSPKEIKIADCPLILAEFARVQHLNGTSTAGEKPEPGNTGFDLLRGLAGVPQGERDDAIFRVACSFRAGNMSKKLAIQLVSEAALKCEPPFPVKTALRKINDAWRKYKPGSDKPILELEHTQDWLALRFSERYGDDLRYTADWGHWYQWEKYVWRRDNTIHVYDLARDLCREYGRQAPNPKVKKELADARTVAAIERMCKADRRHAMTIEQWDEHLIWLNMPKGVLEMDKDKLRPNRREDYFTKVTAVGPDHKMHCPLWNALLERVIPESEMRLYLQRVVGYCLTGSVQEHALFFFYGLGANGKTTILNALTGLMGDYAATTKSDILMVSRNDRHPTEVAALQGARLVVANEIERGKTWDEAQIGELTGGSRLQARFMRQDFFQFWPQFKLIISGNHKPSLRGVTEAMRRRFHLFPFNVTIPEKERDTELGNKLRAEWPGILAWGIEGVQMWRRDGLNPPAAARLATDEYLAKEDSTQEWIDECCVVGSEFSAKSSLLFLSWKSWAERRNEYVGSQKNFSQNLLEKNYVLEHSRNGTQLRGLAIKSQDEPSY